MVVLIVINMLFIKDHATVSVETRAVMDQMLTIASIVSTSAQAAWEVAGKSWQKETEEDEDEWKVTPASMLIIALGRQSSELDGGCTN